MNIISTHWRSRLLFLASFFFVLPFPFQRAFYRKRILELKCCLGSGIFTAAVKRGVAPHTRKQRVLAAISKLRSAFLRVIRTKFARTNIYNYVTGSRKRDHFGDLLESRYRRLNSDNNNITFFADLSFLLANGSRIFPLPLYQTFSFVLLFK